MSATEPERGAAKVAENIALMDRYIQADYDVAVQDSRAISVRAGGLLVANAAVLTVAATIAGSTRDAGGLGPIALSIAAGAAVLSVLVAAFRGLARDWDVVSMEDLKRLTSEKTLGLEPVEVRGGLVATRMSRLADLGLAIDKATTWMNLATVLLAGALIALAVTVGWVVAEPSRPAPTHVVIDSPALHQAERDHRRRRRDRDDDRCRSQHGKHRHPVCHH